MKTLIVIDMQNDFVTGVLGSKDVRSFDTMQHREMPSFVGFKIVFSVCVSSENHLIPGNMYASIFFLTFGRTATTVGKV